MASQIQLTRSGISGVQPEASELEYGELALNYADGKLFYKDDQNNLKPINDTYLNSNNTIYVNSINSAEPKIGLNSTSPEYLLDLGGTTDSTNNTLRINQSAGGTAIRIGAASGGDVTLMRVDSTNGATNNQGHGFSIDYLGVDAGNNDKLAIMADNQSGTAVQALTILQDGKIGIGADTPTKELEVSGRIQVTNSTNFMVFNDGEEDIGFINNNFKKLQINAGGSVDALQLQTNGANALVIDNNQNVGIGTTTPISTAKVHVRSGAPRLVLDGFSASSENDEISRLSGLWDGTYVADIRFLAGDDTTDKDNGKIEFRTYTSNGNTSRSMIIDEVGNIGIGNIDPTVKLEVDGDVTATGNAIAATPTADTHLTTKAYVDNRTYVYRPGEVIEGFSALCNGRSVTVTSGTYTITAQNGGHTVDTTPAAGANEFTLYNGAVETGQRTNNPADADKTDDLRASIIKYKLPTGAKRVCYEFHLEQARVDTNTIIEYSTFIGDGAGTDSKNANLSSSPGDETYTRLEGQAFTTPYAVDGGHIVATINLEIVDDVNDENVSQGIIFRGNWPAGGRTLVVNADSYGGSHDALLYASTHQDGAHDVYFVRPFMKITTYA